MSVNGFGECAIHAKCCRSCPIFEFNNCLNRLLPPQLQRPQSYRDDTVPIPDSLLLTPSTKPPDLPISVNSWHSEKAAAVCGGVPVHHTFVFPMYIPFVHWADLAPIHFLLNTFSPTSDSGSEKRDAYRSACWFVSSTLFFSPIIFLHRSGCTYNRNLCNNSQI